MVVLDLFAKFEKSDLISEMQRLILQMTYRHIYSKYSPNKHTTSQERRYNVAATSRRCSDVVTTLLRHCVFAGRIPKYSNSFLRADVY